MKLWTWASSSLRGHVVLFELFVALPNWVLLSMANYSEGTLSLNWSAHIAFYCLLGGASVAVLFWFTITSPWLKRKARKS
jgi:hypothetical protein